MNDKPNFTIGGCLELAWKIPDPVYVANPLLTRGQLGTLTALPGHGKTTFMIGLMVALALQRPFGTIAPESTGLYYIVSAEDVPGTRNRIFAEAERNELSTSELAALDGRLRWLQVDTYGTATEIADAIAVDADGANIALIFVDTGPALFNGADENDNVALRDFVANFRQMRELPSEPCTVLAWHPTKGAGEDRLYPRGASAIGGSTDFNITLWREDDRITIAHTKLRSPHYEPIEGRLSVVVIDPPRGASALASFTAPVIVMGLTGDHDKPERNDARQGREAILRPMYRANGNPPSVRDLARAAGISASSAGKHLQHMASARPPLVVKDAISDQYKLTKDGATRARELVEQDGRAYQNAQDPG